MERHYGTLPKGRDGEEIRIAHTGFGAGLVLLKQGAETRTGAFVTRRYISISCKRLRNFIEALQRIESDLDREGRLPPRVNYPPRS